MRAFVIAMAASLILGINMTRAQENTNSPAAGTTNAILSAADQQFLLKLARDTISSYLKTQSVPEPAEKDLSPALKQKLGCFVTLNHRDSGLRGCIGIFERTSPLYSNVISRAIAASTQDTRFPRVTPGELKDIQLEISVLTEPAPLSASSPDDLLMKLRPNIDGVILYTRFGWRQSTFLPQVWEQLPDKEEFLAHLCDKQRAPANTWKTDFKNIRVETYQALVFHEKTFGGN